MLHQKINAPYLPKINLLTKLGPLGGMLHPDICATDILGTMCVASLKVNEIIIKNNNSRVRLGSIHFELL